MSEVRIETIEDVVNAQLCTGCGVCAYMEPQRYRMGDALEFGRRPFVIDDATTSSTQALAVCPGVKLSHSDKLGAGQDEISPELLAGWGPVYGVWEAYAIDDEIRRAGSSGGAATALSLFCIEHEGMAGVLHTAARGTSPILNETVFSTTREQLLARTGSRYAPASPADGLSLVEVAERPCVFVGKPCDAAAVQNARKLRPAVDKNIGIVVAFFCAGTPSTKGNLELLRTIGIADPSSVKELRYRGNGWPGMWTVRYTNIRGEEETRQMTYAESWGFLQKYRQWRCYVCPDHTGEFADIAVGDPWYRPVQPDEPGKSLIVARTQRGLALIKAAAAAGYLVLEREAVELLPASQPNLLGSRGALWARLITLRVMGAAVPRFSGFGMFQFWIKNLSFKEKLSSFAGTVKRVYIKKLSRPCCVTEWEAEPRQ